MIYELRFATTTTTTRTRTMKITATIDGTDRETTEATIYADGHLVCEVTLRHGDIWGSCPDYWCSDIASLREVAARLDEEAASLAVEAVQTSLDARDASTASASVEVLTLTGGGNVALRVRFPDGRVKRFTAFRVRQARYAVGGLSLFEDPDTDDFCERHGWRRDLVEQTASAAFREAWMDPEHPHAPFTLSEAVDIFADNVEFSAEDLKLHGVRGLLREYRGWCSALGVHQTWDLLFSAAEIAAMEEWAMEAAL